MNTCRRSPTMQLTWLMWQGLCLAAVILLLLTTGHANSAKTKKEKVDEKMRNIKKDLTSLITKIVRKPEVCNVFADKGDIVTVDYTGRLEDETVFDTSKGREPITFKLGSKRVIEGWDMGIKGMCVGEDRMLIIPPNLAYGDEGYPPQIPGKATLEFDVKLVNLQKASTLASILSFLKFAALPVSIGLAIYFAYHKYRTSQLAGAADTTSKKKLKEEKRLKKRK